MKKAILTLCFISFILSNTKAQALADIEIIRSRFYTEYLSASHSSATATRQSQETSGLWLDIDYVNKFPMAHLERLLKMAASYQTPRNAEYKNPLMLTAVTKGLEYWMANVFTFKYTNWFDFDIGQQTYLQKILILMQGSISESLLLSGTSLLSTQRPKESWIEGQNLVWILGQKLHRGVLLKDAADMRSALDSIQMQLDVTKYTGKIQKSDGSYGSGIQEDYSFFQHGAQFYNCGYGRSFLQDQLPYAMQVRETSFALQPERLEVLTNLLLTTSILYRNSLFNDPAQGRGIAIARTNKNNMVPLLETLITLNPAKKKEAQDLLGHFNGTGKKYSFNGNKHFWNGDFMTHQRAAYYASVRTCSNRTIGTESFDGDNRKGYWNPFGIQFITRNGTEYYNIFPLWNWARIPGVTCPNTIPSFNTQNQSQTETFVGGVSDGTYGMSTITMNKYYTEAKKSVFYFDNEIVSLGAGITSSHAQPVNTGLNQCYLKGNVVVDNVVLAKGKEHTLSAPKWVLHDSIGYIFPQPSDVTLINKSVTGSWSEIGSGSTSKITADVFNLWINHGVKPNNDTYQYIIVPGVSQQSLTTYAAANPIQVIANSPRVQAVRQTVLNITQVAFYQKGSIETPDFKIEVDQPCLLMTKVKGDSIFISTSNPVQTNLTLNVTITIDNVARTLTYNFAMGSAAGKTQTKHILMRNGKISAYPQFLPINHYSFFRSSAIGVDSLVKATYATYTLPIMPDQWNNMVSEFSPGSPTLLNSSLSYSNYGDNGAGKAILSTGNRRYAYYSLTSENEYTAQPFYVSALINFTEVKNGDAFVLFGKDYVGNFSRGKLSATSYGTGYSLGVQMNAENIVYGNKVLAYGTTHLVVVKVTPSATGTEQISVFVNPTIGGTEPQTPEAKSSAPAILNQIQSIGFRTTATGEIAGLRFSDNWADAVSAEHSTGVASTIENASIRISGRTIIASEPGTIEVYNLQGVKLIASRVESELKTNLDNGVYIIRFVNLNAKVTTQKIIIHSNIAH